jgi:hypothetical protein
VHLTRAAWPYPNVQWTRDCGPRNNFTLAVCQTQAEQSAEEDLLGWRKQSPLGMTRRVPLDGAMRIAGQAEIGSRSSINS